MGKAQQTLNQSFSPTFNSPPRGYLLIVSKLKIYQHPMDASFHKVVKSYLIHKATKKAIAIDQEIMRKDKDRGYNLQYLDITATTEKFLHIDELGILSNTCPSCGCINEDMSHVVRCPSPGRTAFYNEARPSESERACDCEVGSQASVSMSMHRRKC
eukprot:scaffold2215_cov101-Skeletonema_dohrnii-CCMP3373.AAC.1